MQMKEAVNYRGGEFAVEYCGGCIFANHTGNAFTCDKMFGAKVEPGNVCDLFQASDEVDIPEEFAEEKEGENHARE